MEALVVLAINLAFPVAMGIICAMIAQTRGRSAVGWFFIGFFLSCIGVILVLVLPDLRQEQQRIEKLRREHLRQKEKQRKDRQVADQRYAEISRRIDTHDRALGLDTAERESLLEESRPPEIPVAKRSPFAAIDWYYVLDGDAKGPVPFDELRELSREGLVRTQSLVWHEGLEEWATLDEVPGLEEELHGR